MRPTTLSRNIAITAAISMLMAGSALAETGRDLTVAHRPTGPAYIESSGPLNISLVPTTASVLKIGSSIGFSIGSTAGGYASLYALSASGKVQLWLENVPIRAGGTISYPTRGGVIRATPPAGDEKILMVVTRTRIAGFAHGTVRSPLVLPYTHEAFRQALAGKTSALASDDWTSTELTVRIEDR